MLYFDGLFVQRWDKQRPRYLLQALWFVISTSLYICNIRKMSAISLQAICPQYVRNRFARNMSAIYVGINKSAIYLQALCVVTPNLPTSVVDFTGFDSSTIGGVPMSTGNLPESSSQAMLVGTILVGGLSLSLLLVVVVVVRLGVCQC